MMPSELDKSNEIMGRIFLALLDCGLRATDIYASKLLVDSFEAADDKDMVGIYYHFRDVGKWMVRERLMVADMVEEDRIVRAQLTAKGVALAQRKFRIEGQETTIRKQFETTRSETDNYTNIGSLIGGLIGGTIRSMGS